MEYRRIGVKRLAPALGAEILGPDLSQPLDEETWREIKDAFREYLVIFFRDQTLTPEQHKTFGRGFGELIPVKHYESVPGHPEIFVVRKEKEDNKNVGSVWHSDKTHDEKPPLASVFYALEVPPLGGDTLFANQYMAYEALSESMKRLLAGKTAVHSNLGLLGRRDVQKSQGQVARAMSDTPLPEIVSEHPVVVTHPISGRKALYINGLYCLEMSDLTPDESGAILRFLSEHAVRPEFTCRFRWEQGSVALWDNRAVQHSAINDYHGFRRLGHRICVAGDRPTI